MVGRGLSEADPEISERGGWDTCQLNRYYLFYQKFFRNNTKFHRKRSGHGLLAGQPHEGVLLFNKWLMAQVTFELWLQSTDG